MEEFVRRTRPRLVRVARRIGAPQDAEDSVQAAYHALLRRAERPDDVVGWLVSTVVRIAYRRKAATRREAALAERLARPRDEADAARAAVRGEEDAHVRSAVHRLPARYRDAVVLHHIEGLPLADVARLLDVPEATAKTRVQRGRALLRWRLAPAFAHGVLVVPWAFADVVRGMPHSAAWIGGAMKTKTAAAVALGTAFAVGAATGTVVMLSVKSPPASDVSAAAPANAPTHFVRPRRVPAAAPARQEAPTEPAPAEPAPLAEPKGDTAKGDAEIPDAVRRAATDLGVSGDALRAAMAAFAAVSGRDEAKAKSALAALHGFGEDGFRAVVALLRGGVGSTYSERLVEASWSQGGERLLMDLAETRPVGEPQWAPHLAVWCLGAADTPAVREWLLARAASETDPSRYMNVTHALGRLKEARGIALCQDKLAKRADVDWNVAWNEAIRSYILGDVAMMARGDADAGKRAFVTYLRDDGADRIDRAIRSLHNLDPAAAKAEAAALLAGPRAQTFNSDTISALRDAAK